MTLAIHIRNGHTGRVLAVVRFADKFDASAGEDGCWPWLPPLDAYGYGQFWDGNRPVRAHRFSYELFVGPIPDGLTLDHLCMNRACVSPYHLEPVTQGENARRGALHNRTHCVSGHPFDEANTVLNKKGWRTCRTCQRTKEARKYA